jgi:hypothetical protein
MRNSSSTIKTTGRLVPEYANSLYLPVELKTSVDVGSVSTHPRHSTISLGETCELGFDGNRFHI